MLKEKQKIVYELEFAKEEKEAIIHAHDVLYRVREELNKKYGNWSLDSNNAILGDYEFDEVISFLEDLKCNDSFEVKGSSF